MWDLSFKYVYAKPFFQNFTQFSRFLNLNELKILFFKKIYNLIILFG